MRIRANQPLAPVIRELARGDEATVEAVFAGLTPEQRWQRFHAAMPRLPLTVRRTLADVDGHDRVALVVELGERAIGIGRYTRIGAAVAEIALAVVAEHTGRGIGKALLEALVRRALQAGIEELVFEVIGTNSVALHLARSRGARLERTPWVVHGSLTLGVVPHTSPAA
ncbi:N-acetyltransferase family protein [Nocardioides sp.]|uniref:GNAT family N-acetyltransferase n=1 Tax=Nocardioides sp. TaxID=35761 RepID=UPI003562DA6A